MRTWTGAQSGSGSCSERSTGIQYRRKNSPIGAPRLVRVNSSFWACVSIALLRGGLLSSVTGKARACARVESGPWRCAMLVTVSDVVSPSYFVATAAVELGYFKSEGVDAEFVFQP